MAVFDPDRRCYVGRVVFDGAALAGKTTNLKKVCELLPVDRRTEMYTPGSLKGRTMFFDWMEVDGPVTPGIALKFQLITVPGQVERNHRRRPLVEMADTVVFVFDCSPAGHDASMHAWKRLRAVLKRRERPVPLIVQANKQDVPSAKPPEEVAQLLKVEPAQVLAATSSTGGGVQKTIVTALKLARTELKAQLDAGLLQHVTADSVDADALFFSMLERDEQGIGREPDELEGD